MSKIQVITDEMHSIANGIGQRVGAIRSSHDTVMRLIESLGSGFSGSLPSLMIQYVRSHRNGYRSIDDALTDYKDFIDWAADNYEWNDQQLAKWKNTGRISPTPRPAPGGGTGGVSQNYGDPKRFIWDFLREKIGNDYGVAALMGNLHAESSLRSNNLQNSYEGALGMTDDEYTAAVDNGSYGNFIYDSAGYGIAQWTYYSRKQALLEFAREKGTSVGDLRTQLEFLWKELSEGYPDVLNTLKTASSIREASDVVLKRFERPADQSDHACATRAGYAESLYSELMA